ncbi:MAG: RNA-directed DNA polymerase [Moritella dasanensis]|jgi:RNA-directed DNA polymerase
MMTTSLNTIAFKAQTHPKHRFHNFYGLLNADSLYQSWGQLNKQAKSGIDGITMPIYKANLMDNIERVGQQLKQKCYRVDDIKRIFIPESNGKLRPLGLPTVDDKLVQQSVS